MINNPSIKYRKPTFFTSDLHLGHENSIKFDKRPFRNLEHMHSEIIKRFNSTVPRDGITYFLGDISTCSAEVLKKIISELHGTKVIVVGNHDRPYNSLYLAGFDVVLHNATIYIANQKVTMSHCPLLGIPREDMSEYPHKGINWHGEFKQTRFTIPDEGQFHLHGHIHSPNDGKSVKILGRQFDVGAPANHYRPVHIGEIESWISKTLALEKMQEIR